MMENIDYLRNCIDEIDKELVALFEKRMDTVLKIAEYKKNNDMPILDKKREEEVIRKNLNYLNNKELESEAAEFFNSLMSISRNYQCKKISNPTQNIEVLSEDVQENVKEITSGLYKSKINAGFQGVCGSFSEQALIEFFGQGVKRRAYKYFEDVFTAIANEEIEFGVLPIENSSTGSVAEVYDMLRKYGLYITGEKCVRVEHNLLGIKGAEIEDIKEVYSHAQAFQQSKEFLKQYEEWKLIPYRNTAASAELVSKEKDIKKAAVASKKAAELYNLEIIKEKINYNSNNYTRFLIIGKTLECTLQSNKISIVITVPHKAGALYNILKNFAVNNLNMQKIESRPIIDKAWEYFFYIDFEGNLKDERVKSLIKEISSNCSYFKLLGNYEAAKLKNE